MSARDNLKNSQSGFALILFVLAISGMLITAALVLQFSLISPVEQNVILRSALSKAQQVVALSISATLKNSSGFDHTVNSSYNDGVFECLRTGAFCPQASTEVNAILDSDGKILYHKTSQFSFDLSGKTCNQPGVSPCLLGVRLRWQPNCPYGCSKPRLYLEIDFQSLDSKLAWSRRALELI